ncbi:MAG: HEAT repeat domain-containing protein [Limisphaerales bacterium]
MSKRWGLWAILGAGIVGVISALFLLGPPEPVYQGKPISFWFAQNEAHGGADPLSEEARKAFYDFGSNAVPFLVAELQPSTIRRFYYDNWPRLPVALRRRLPIPGSPYNDQFQAVMLLGELGPDARAAVPALVLIAKNDPRYVHISRTSGALRVVQVFRERSGGYYLTDPWMVPRNQEVSLLRAQAMGALAAIGGDAPEAFFALFDVMHDRDPRVASMADGSPIVDFASHLRPLAPELMAAALRFLDDPSDLVRSAAARVLIRAGGGYGRVAPALIRRLTDSSRRVRDQAQQTLARLSRKSELVVPLLADSLSSPDLQLQINAVKTLTEIGSPAKTAVASLTQMLKSPDRQARYQAGVALWKIDGQVAPLIPFRIEELKDATESVRRDAADFLGRCGPAARAAVPALVEMLHDEDARLHGTHAELVGGIGYGATSGVPALTQALGRIEYAARPAVPALTQPLGDDRSSVRAAAAGALKRIDPDAAAKAGIK